LAAFSNLGTASYAEFLVLVSATQQPSSLAPLADDVNRLLLVSFPRTCKQVVAEVPLVLEAPQVAPMEHQSIVHQCWPMVKKNQ
jgi:hypothetical protein